MLKAWLHEGRAIFLRKLGSTAAAKVLRREHMIVGREFGGGLTQPTPGAAGRNDLPPSSDLSDGEDGSRACSLAGTAKMPWNR